MEKSCDIVRSVDYLNGFREAGRGVDKKLSSVYEII